MEIKGLTEDKLLELYQRVVYERKIVNSLVDEFGYSASQLVSRQFEQDVEKEYCRKVLKRLTKIELEKDASPQTSNEARL